MTIASHRRAIRWRNRAPEILVWILGIVIVLALGSAMVIETVHIGARFAIAHVRH